ncbi:hypothetical protein ACJIZ3_020706 [Penstemon smallii]|uniref:Uncharacterized protein n=1 Tax=Penstemon smallii TaxID=265156 RepID=A0ABD3SK59_9LAMI
MQLSLPQPMDQEVVQCTSTSI